MGTFVIIRLIAGHQGADIGSLLAHAAVDMARDPPLGIDLHQLLLCHPDTQQFFVVMLYHFLGIFHSFLLSLELHIIADSPACAVILGFSCQLSRDGSASVSGGM